MEKASLPAPLHKYASSGSLNSVSSDRFTSMWGDKGWTPPSLDTKRDLVGYGNPRNLPKFSWPEKKKIAVSFVLNFEEGSELSVGDGDEQNENVHEVTEEQGDETRDYCVESHFEYGTRVGYWRVIEAFDRYGVKMTVSSCGRAVERSPWIVQDAASRGHEIAAHGYRWSAHAGMSEEEEIRAIDLCSSAIEDAIGKKPVGWHTRSKRSNNTRRLLMERGFLYSDDAYNDDTPYYVDINGNLHLILPYAFDTNDMQFQNTTRFNTARSFSEYVCDSFDWLVNHENFIPRMMTIGLHLRIIGRPGRMPALYSILEHITKSGKAWIVPREEIAKHWINMTAEENSILKSKPLNSGQVVRKSRPQKSFNLLVINPNTSTTATDLIMTHVRQNLPPSVKAVGVTATIGAPTIASESSYAVAQYAVIEAYNTYMNTEGRITPQVILVGCFGDPGVFALREIVEKEGRDIKVIGLAEASMRFALQTPGNYSIITGGEAWGPILRRLAKDLDLTDRLSDIRCLSSDGRQLSENRTLGLNLLRQEILAHNSDPSSIPCTTVILGGGLLAGMAKDIVNVPMTVLDCVQASVSHILAVVKDHTPAVEQ
eukprot:TRINITY_DN562_c0_g1_i3.p1 TRINITY_DN562_c0_g1~~TRINITY_DN562_c0_g1_i3.p1  ORF type:complete len:598 (+),score=88.61 TRINITY_DN562_c0_g1_i3:564-2357(+)